MKMPGTSVWLTFRAFIVVRERAVRIRTEPDSFQKGSKAGGNVFCFRDLHGFLLDLLGSCFVQGFHAQADFAVFYADDLDFNRIALGQYRLGMLDAFITDLGNVYKAGKTVSESYECTIILQGLYGSFGDQSDLYVGNTGFALFLGFFLQNLPGRQNQAFLFGISSDDTDLYFLQQPVLQIFRVFQRQSGSGNESADPFHISDDAFVDDTFDLYCEVGAILHIFLKLIPCEHIVGKLSGKENIAVAVVCADNGGRNGVAYSNIMLDGEVRFVGIILQTDNALGIGFQVQNHFGFRNTYDSTLQNISFFNFTERSFQLLIIGCHCFFAHG